MVNEFLKYGKILFHFNICGIQFLHSLLWRPATATGKGSNDVASRSRINCRSNGSGGRCSQNCASEEQNQYQLRDGDPARPGRGRDLRCHRCCRRHILAGSAGDRSPPRTAQATERVVRRLVRACADQSIGRARRRIANSTPVSAAGARVSETPPSGALARFCSGRANILGNPTRLMASLLYVIPSANG